MNAFSKVLILVIIVILLAGGILTWQYFRPAEEVEELVTVEEEIEETIQEAKVPEEKVGPEKEIEKDYIKVISPNGGEQLVEGTWVGIEWTQESLGEENISIYLNAFDENGNSLTPAPQYQGPRGMEDFYVIYAKAPANHKGLDYLSPGHYGVQWFIPRDSGDRFLKLKETPAKYKIVIRRVIVTPEISDESDAYFNITGKTCHTSPLWGWDYCSPTCKCYAGEGNCDTDADCETDYCAQNVGAKYGQHSLKDVCEEKEKSITILSPNGGEGWEIGKTYEIKWEAKDLEEVWIKIINYSVSTERTFTITRIDALRGIHFWTIPSDFFKRIPEWESGNKLKMSLCDCPAIGPIEMCGCTIIDESNDYFTIVAPNL